MWQVLLNHLEAPLVQSNLLVCVVRAWGPLSWKTVKRSVQLQSWVIISASSSQRVFPHYTKSATVSHITAVIAVFIAGLWEILRCLSQDSPYKTATDVTSFHKFPGVLVLFFWGSLISIAKRLKTSANLVNLWHKLKTKKFSQKSITCLFLSGKYL